MREVEMIDGSLTRPGRKGTAMSFTASLVVQNRTERSLVEPFVKLVFFYSSFASVEIQHAGAIIVRRDEPQDEANEARRTSKKGLYYGRRS